RPARQREVLEEAPNAFGHSSPSCVAAVRAGIPPRSPRTSVIGSLGAGRRCSAWRRLLERRGPPGSAGTFLLSPRQARPHGDGRRRRARWSTALTAVHDAGAERRDCSTAALGSLPVQRRVFEPIIVMALVLAGWRARWSWQGS